MTTNQKPMLTAEPGLLKARAIRPKLADEAMYGLPGRVARTLTEHSEADPAAVLLTFLVLLGNAAGPGAHITMGGLGKHSACEFLMLVGEQSQGRKGTALNLVHELFAQADSRWAQSAYLDEIESGQAFVDELARRQVDDCRLVLWQEEVSQLLSVLPRNKSMSVQLRKLWDGQSVSHNTQKIHNNVTQPHVSVIGGITPHELAAQRHFFGSAGGLESRFLFAYVVKGKDVNPMGAASEIPDALVKEVGDVLDFTRERVMEQTDVFSRELCLLRGLQPGMNMSPPRTQRGTPTSWASERAMSRLKRQLGEIRSHLPNVGDELLARDINHLGRLAVAYAIADSCVVVQPEHIQAALALWRFCALSAKRIVGVVGTAPPMVKPAHRQILLAGLDRFHGNGIPWVSKSDIINVIFGKNVKVENLDPLLAEMEEEEFLRRRKLLGRPGAPKPVTEYQLISMEED